MQSSTSTPSPKPQPETQSPSSELRVAIARPRGMPFEEFKRRCVQAFIEKGIIKPEGEQPSSNSAASSPDSRPTLAELKEMHRSEMLEGLRSQSQKRPDEANTSA